VEEGDEDSEALLQPNKRHKLEQVLQIGTRLFVNGRGENVNVPN
jgi:hypothetical protein